VAEGRQGVQTCTPLGLKLKTFSKVSVSQTGGYTIEASLPLGAFLAFNGTKLTKWRTADIEVPNSQVPLHMYTNHKNIIYNISCPLFPKHDTRTSLDVGYTIISETLSTPHRALSGALSDLTVHPCGEPCGSAAGFDFLTGEVIQREKIYKEHC
jgi:hypothetical protein